jgi:hypothetical protein
MKNIWECEICGARFYDEKNCVAHENEHNTEQVKLKERETKKRESTSNLNKLYKNYVDARENMSKLYKEYVDATEKHKKEFEGSSRDFWWGFF